MGDSKGGRRPLTYDDRLAIERGLNRGDRIAWIARTIGRAPKVVAEEVKRNWTDDPQGMLVVRTRNICSKAGLCEVRGLCKGMCRARCSRCKDFLCNSLCPDFEAKPCEKLARSPFCCNACPSRVGGGCRHPYRYYQAKWAQDAADARRSESRQGIDCDPEAFESAITLISDGLAKGQSPQHIFAANPGAIPFGVRSLYNYLGGAKAGDLSKLDLPKAVRYKPRSKSKSAKSCQHSARGARGEAVDGFLRPRPGRPRQRRRDGHGGREAGQGLAVHLDAVRQAHRVPVLHPPTGQVGDQRGRGARHPPGALRAPVLPGLRPDPLRPRKRVQRCGAHRARQERREAAEPLLLRSAPEPAKGTLRALPRGA